MYDVKKLPLDKLVASDLDDDLNMVDVPVPYFIDEDNYLCVDCESEIFVADYYCEFGLEFNPKVEKWAEDNGGYWEWKNPGCIMFVK